MQGVQAIAKAAPATTGPPLPARASRASTCHSWFSRVMKRVETKKTPMSTISAPEILVSSSLLSCRTEPSPVAVRPSRMKIAEKLATKSRLGPSTRRQLAFSSSFGETPVTAER
jgi:hypothetical protein